MVRVLAFYHFTPLDDADQLALHAELEGLGTSHGLRGLILLGREGVNLTAAGDDTAIAELRRRLTARFSPAAAQFKDSTSARPPFRVLRVKRRGEIVTLGRPDLVPAGGRNHLTPAEWQAALNDPDVVVLDTRNDYEVELGRFKGAVDFATREFREFPARLRDSGIPKDKKVLIYCTGGIRCEKAIMELNEQGYADVHQLEGGILNYLAEYPNQAFEGECFVFDYRVAVDQALRPTARYLLCPHCGQPANVEVSCAQCASPATLCARCEASEPTCSKNCAHHRAIGSKSRRAHAPERAKRRRAGDQSADSASAGD